MKRILTIQDVSGVGKCSLTVALPIISAAQVEACVLPTAVLSTHTRFKHFTFADLTDEIEPTVEVWQKEGITFDAIYTGYLGSYRQMGLVENLIDAFHTKDNFIFIDPVLGDAGTLYARFDQSFVDIVVNHPLDLWPAFAPGHASRLRGFVAHGHQHHRLHGMAIEVVDYRVIGCAVVQVVVNEEVV